MISQGNHQTTISLSTGAGRGLGRNTVLSIARGGGDVVITYHSNAEQAQAVVTDVEAMGRRALVFQLDSGKSSALPLLLSSSAPSLGRAGDLSTVRLGDLCG